MALAIERVRAIVCAPEGINLVVVRVETSEPGLYGLGCGTFAYRWRAVVSVVEDYLDPLLRGRDPARIEELHQLMSQNAYWRNGPIDNNAISGVDMALWDIQGKRAGMPVYQLLGGKLREGAAVYRHADGTTLEELMERIARFAEEGDRHVRAQFGGYGGAGRVLQGEVGRPSLRPSPFGMGSPRGAASGVYYDPSAYMRQAIEALERARSQFGASLELLHDAHERLPPDQAVAFAKEVEPLRLFFLEDLLAPEHVGHFERVRQVCATPLAMGELFCHPLEWTPLVAARRIDFLRMHLSAIGGLTPARKAAALGESFGVRTAWHGPGDVSPVGHAANVHLDLASPNFGIQEHSGFKPNTREVFRGVPELRDGYVYVSDAPGLGVELDEEAAKRFPPRDDVTEWTQTRLPDGSLHRP